MAQGLNAEDQKILETARKLGDGHHTKSPVMTD